MKPIVMPMQVAAGQPARRLTQGVRLAEHLARAFDRLAGFIRHGHEDEIVRQYEGHSWCDSTERDMVYDIMNGKHSRH